MWNFPEGASKAPCPVCQAHGGKLLLRTHLMERPLSALTLKHGEVPACWAQDLASHDNSDFLPEGMGTAVPAVSAAPLAQL